MRAIYISSMVSAGRLVVLEGHIYEFSVHIF